MPVIKSIHRRLAILLKTRYSITMTQIEQDILRTLVDLDTAAKTIRIPDPKPDLQALFARMDELTRRLPADAAPDLRHYLKRKSYEKARLFLEGREAENQRGSCGH
jgi:hypothetical protein